MKNKTCNRGCARPDQEMAKEGPALRRFWDLKKMRYAKFVLVGL